MRICIHTVREINRNYIGGTERLLLELAKELQILGCDPFIVCSGKENPFAIEGVPIIHKVPKTHRKDYDRFGIANSKFLKEVVFRASNVERGLRNLGDYTDAQLENVNADIYHLNSFAMSAFSEAAKNSFIWNHENNEEYDAQLGVSFSNSFFELVNRGKTNLDLAKFLATPSAHYASYYTEKFGLPVAAINGGVSLLTFPRKKTCQRKMISGDVLTILMPSRFSPYQKGHDIALNASAVLDRRNVNHKLIFSGLRKDYREKIDKFVDTADRLGVKKNISIQQFKDMNIAYEECDLVISPERYCSYGLSISESLSLGIPTVLSDIPTYQEIGGCYTHAFFFRKNNHLDLAEKIQDAAAFDLADLNSSVIEFRIKNDIRNVAINIINRYKRINNNNFL